MNKKKNGLILSILGILGLIVITAGVTYAFFNYAKEGTTDNVITTGSITFLYTEVSGVGNGISIENAYPISDEVGKVKTGDKEYFDFKITSDTFGDASIPYEITARKKADSTLDEEAVRMYLVDQDTNEELLLENYNKLTQTSKVEASKHIEKTIYTGKVPADTKDYEKNFRLRMWIDKNIDFSQNEDGAYPYNGKTFTVTINVYANAKVITADEEELMQNANIKTLEVAGTELTAVENQNYNYEMTLPAGTKETEINVETENEYAQVSIERIDSLAYSSSVKKLSTKKILQLNNGENYFKITVKSEDEKVTGEYILKVVVEATYKAYSIGDAVTAVDGSKWHVLEASDEDSDTIVLFSDYNMNEDGTYNTDCQGTMGDAASFRCSTMSYDAAVSFVNNKALNLVIASLPGTISVALPTAGQIATAEDGTIENYYLALTKSWLITTNYWVKTGSDGSGKWYVGGNAQVLARGDNISTAIGTRPVITTPKTNLVVEQ